MGNTMCIHASMQVKEAKPNMTKSFYKGYYNIGGLEYSMIDIEHRIIRGSHSTFDLTIPGLGSMMFGNSKFEYDDPRSVYTINERQWDPRINFALANCTAIGGHLEVFSPKEGTTGILHKCQTEYLKKHTQIIVPRNQI